MTKLIYLRGLFVINLLLITLVNNAQNPLTNTIEDIMEDISVNNYDEENIEIGRASCRERVLRLV